jgi:HPt (histidine-containing phosphotransfer) domain-containing protein
MSDDDLNIRLVKVEQRLESLCRELTEDKAESKHQLERIVEALDDLKKESSKNRGFFGGIVFAVSACFAVIVYALGKM